MGMITKVMIGLIIFTAMTTAIFGFYESMADTYDVPRKSTRMGNRTQEIMSISEQLTAKSLNTTSGVSGFITSVEESILIGFRMFGIILNVPDVVGGAVEDVQEVSESQGILIPQWFVTMVIAITIVIFVMAIASVVLKSDL